MQRKSPCQREIVNLSFPYPIGACPQARKRSLCSHSGRGREMRCRPGRFSAARPASPSTEQGALVRGPGTDAIGDSPYPLSGNAWCSKMWDLLAILTAAACVAGLAYLWHVTVRQAVAGEGEPPAPEHHGPCLECGRLRNLPGVPRRDGVVVVDVAGVKRKAGRACSEHDTGRT